MKLCCVDVGTNSVLSLLTRIDSKGRITPLEFHAETTRLGETPGIIKKEAKTRTISAIKKNIIGADKYIIVGTSALREAKNRDGFIESLRKETGRSIRILSSSKEAELIFKSVKYFLRPLPRKTIVCDIGGGSTEFIFCVNGKLIKKISIPVGAVKLTERFLPFALPSSPWERPSLIGVGGTVTTLGAILKGLKHYNPNKVHKTILSYEKVVDTLKRLNSMSLSKRKKLISFDPKRADIIVAGLYILKTIMEHFRVDRFKICDRGLVYGLAVDYAKYTRGTFSLHKTS